MEITINVQSPQPIYEQIVQQIQLAAQSGRLGAGTALPSVRQLAHDLDLNHNTVAKAYKILEANRIIHTAGRRGTFIREHAVTNIQNLNSQYAVAQMTDLLSSLLNKGLTTTEIRNSFKTALDVLNKDRKT